MRLQTRPTKKSYKKIKKVVDKQKEMCYNKYIKKRKGSTASTKVNENGNY